MDTTFRRRCQLALTHPVTVGALGILLLNDLALKQLWANPWTTGKLRDLAWVAFASPLLAFPLALLVRQHRRGQQAEWVVAYVGLQFYLIGKHPRNPESLKTSMFD